MRRWAIEFIETGIVIGEGWQWLGVWTIRVFLAFCVIAGMFLILSDE